MASGKWKKRPEGEQYVSAFLETYKERIRPKIEAEILGLKARLENRLKDYEEAYGEKFMQG
jgi:hypothetical protein